MGFQAAALENSNQVGLWVFQDWTINATLRLMAAPGRGRVPERGRAFEEVFLDVQAAAKTSCAAEAIANGHSMLVQKLASKAECKLLTDWAASTASIEMEKNADYPGYAWGRNAFGRLRMPIAKMLGSGSGCFADGQQALCEELLLRSLSSFETQAPGLNTLLFEGCPQTLAGNKDISFQTGEPAINIYSEGGGIQPHEDKQSLTILVVLSEAGDFKAGGTAFWSAADKLKQGGSLPLKPTLVLKPPVGTAICFGGQVTPLLSHLLSSLLLSSPSLPPPSLLASSSRLLPLASLRIPSHLPRPSLTPFHRIPSHLSSPSPHAPRSQLTHSAVRVLAGKRAVFVASFSRTDPNQREDARWDPLFGWDLPVGPLASPVPSSASLPCHRQTIVSTAPFDHEIVGYDNTLEGLLRDGGRCSALVASRSHPMPRGHAEETGE